MKKIILAFLILGVQIAVAQKVAYIETDIILEKMPAFETASNEINAQVAQWETEIDNKYKSIESMYQEYVNSEAMMPEDVKKQKQDAIFEAEAKVKEFKDQKFGNEGEINALQDEKFGPLYDQIVAAAEAVAVENGYEYVFNKSGENNWIYTKPSNDLTEKVIAKLEL